MKVTDVFTPGSLPEHTYNSREDLRLEWRLLEALETKGIIGSVSGPSKSGKTVLCESVVAFTCPFWKRRTHRSDRGAPGRNRDAGLPSRPWRRSYAWQGQTGVSKTDTFWMVDLEPGGTDKGTPPPATG